LGRYKEFDGTADAKLATELKLSREALMGWPAAVLGVLILFALYRISSQLEEIRSTLARRLPDHDDDDDDDLD
jgi:hypothetical protein